MIYCTVFDVGARAPFEIQVHRNNSETIVFGVQPVSIPKSRLSLPEVLARSLF